ncbi:MAG: hypothetical protein C4523_06350 [Myxococcales bacterium]|nr:MAG: hypothetical protein C4523_06350 [Myxococcales bacterium]
MSWTKRKTTPAAVSSATWRGWLMALVAIWLAMFPSAAWADEDEIEETRRLDYFTVAPKLGYVYFVAHEDQALEISRRHAMLAMVSFDVGDLGYAFETEPYFSIEVASGEKPFYGLGANLQMVYRFYVHHIAPSFGMGVKGGYLFGEELKHGMELYGRFPLAVSFYMGEDIAFLIEVGLMYGITGLQGARFGKDLQFADGFAVDWTVGIRWP